MFEKDSARTIAGMADVESSVDRQVREAIERGEFDNLPGAGQPIPDLARSDNPSWWAKGFIEQARSDNQRTEQVRVFESQLGRLWSIGSVKALRASVESINQEIEQFNQAQTSSRRIEPFDVDAVIETWKKMTRARIRSGQ